METRSLTQVSASRGNVALLEYVWVVRRQLFLLPHISGKALNYISVALCSLAESKLNQHR